MVHFCLILFIHSQVWWLGRLVFFGTHHVFGSAMRDTDPRRRVRGGMKGALVFVCVLSERCSRIFPGVAAISHDN